MQLQTIIKANFFILVNEVGIPTIITLLLEMPFWKLIFIIHMILPKSPQNSKSHQIEYYLMPSHHLASAGTFGQRSQFR